MTVYLILRGGVLHLVEDTMAGAEARVTDRPNDRIVARRGVRPWWRRPADWSVIA